MVFRSISISQEVYDFIKEDMKKSNTNTIYKMIMKYRRAFNKPNTNNLKGKKE